MYSPETSLRNFTVIEKLGKGSFSSVYKVQRLGDSQSYAMKKVKIGEMREKQKQNALNEVRILASITHPNIINYKEAFFDDISQTLCVVMELADAGDIQKKVNYHLENRSYFTEKQIWHALAQMTRGLQALHDAKILHRDLKCANVFCTKDGKYKLGDLNVSKVAKRGMAKTQTGTPYYTSPQVWKDRPYDSKCDIWSLGCVIYEMATLRPPFRASNLKELYSKIQRGIFQRIPSFYSQDLQTIISICLKVNPISRPSAGELLQNPKVIKNMPATDYYQNLEGKNKSALLKTIQVPKNLKCLKQALPKSKYDSDKENTKGINQNKCIEKSINQRRYERVNSAENLNGRKMEIPRVITTPKVDQLKKNQINYALLHRPNNSKSREKEPKSQFRDIQKSVQPVGKISRNNSVDNIRKRISSQNSREISNDRVDKNFLEQITNKCKEVQERVNNLINRKKNNPSLVIQQKKGIQLPRVSSRDRINSNRSIEYRKKSLQRPISRNRSIEQVDPPHSSRNKYIEKSRQKQRQNANSNRYQRNNSLSQKKYVYGLPTPKLRT